MLVLRVGVGLIFLAHGVKHAGGRERTSNWFAGIGFRHPELQWFASTATELIVGVLLVAGFLTSLAAAGIIGIMFVAFWSVHRFVGFFVTARPTEGWEYVATLALTGLALAMLGPGEYSLDHAVGLDDILDGWVGLGFAAGGLAVAAGQLLLFWRPSPRGS